MSEGRDTSPAYRPDPRRETLPYFFELLVIDRLDNRVCVEVARHAFFQSKTAQAVTSTLEGGAIQQFSDLVRKFHRRTRIDVSLLSTAVARAQL